MELGAEAGAGPGALSFVLALEWKHVSVLGVGVSVIVGAEVGSICEMVAGAVVGEANVGVGAGVHVAVRN
jgi:hypothetical protein